MSDIVYNCIEGDFIGGTTDEVETELEGADAENACLELGSDISFFGEPEIDWNE